MSKKKENEVIVIAEQGSSWIQGHEDDEGEGFEFFDIYFGNNSVCVSMTVDGFSEIVDLFREVIKNENKIEPGNN